MIAGARIAVVLAASVVAALALGGCDFSRVKPETAAAQPVAETSAASGERSVRLFGPGVSRQRQTRI